MRLSETRVGRSPGWMMISRQFSYTHPLSDNFRDKKTQIKIKTKDVGRFFYNHKAGLEVTELQPCGPGPRCVFHGSKSELRRGDAWPGV